MPSGRPRGFKHSPETIEKITASRVGRAHSAATRTAISIAQQKPETWGSKTDQTGYVFVRWPNHPLANAKGLVAEHRFVYYETFGEIPGNSVIHHIDHGPATMPWRTWR